MKTALIFIIAVSTSFYSVAQTPRISFTADRFYPEGVVYSSKQQLFYVSSVRTGTIATVNMTGKFNEWYKDASLKSSFGMKIDSTRNLLWVCTGDPNYSVYSDSTTFKKIIRLIALDLVSGKKVKDIDLSPLYSGLHFPNDLTLDHEGNIFLTDSYSPVIYKVDAAGKGSILAESEYFRTPGIGLNGIAWHPGGFLVVVNNGTGALYKIVLNEPTNIQRVKTNTFFPGGDGLLFNSKGQLVLVQNKGVNKVFVLESKDDWKTAVVLLATGTEDRFQQPSTCTLKEGQVYALNSKLNELQDKTISPSKEFSLQLAVFKPAQ